jgi:hypothetical protein
MNATLSTADYYLANAGDCSKSEFIAFLLNKHASSPIAQRLAQFANCSPAELITYLGALAVNKISANLAQVAGVSPRDLNSLLT